MKLICNGYQDIYEPSSIDDTIFVEIKSRIIKLLHDNIHEMVDKFTKYGAKATPIDIVTIGLLETKDAYRIMGRCVVDIPFLGLLHARRDGLIFGGGTLAQRKQEFTYED